MPQGQERRIFYMLRSSRNTLFPVLLALFLSLWIMGTAQAAPAASTVGFVDYGYLIDQHPDTPAANQQLKATQDQAKQDFAEKSAGMSDQDKQSLQQQLVQQLKQKRDDLLKPISDKINAAIKVVADAKGLTIVIGKSVVAYGGVDITADVLKIITGK